MTKPLVEVGRAIPAVTRQIVAANTCPQTIRRETAIGWTYTASRSTPFVSRTRPRQARAGPVIAAAYSDTGVVVP